MSLELLENPDFDEGPFEDPNDESLEIVFEYPTEEEYYV